MSEDPKKLYDLCINSAVSNYIRTFSKKNFRILPNNVLVDFYYKMYLDKKLCLLAVEFSELEIIKRLLFVKHKRLLLLKCFQALIDHSKDVPDILFEHFKKYSSSDNAISSIDLGLKIGYFLNEGGYFKYAIDFLNITEVLCKTQEQDVEMLKKLVDIYEEKIYAEAMYCQFDEAQKTCVSAQNAINMLEKYDTVPNLARLYTKYSLMYFIRSEYDEAYKWSLESLKLLVENDLALRTIIEVLRQASKSCVVKRKFNQAGLLVRQAVNLASILFEADQLPQFSDTLLDYGYYLLNYDSVDESVEIYERALSIREEVFQKNNIHIALALEDLAYALYVKEYSSGNFYRAKDKVEQSIHVMESILPKDHLLLASAKRVKALILEEIALDVRNNSKKQTSYFACAEELHKAALDLSYRAFGEKNVQTAKHYGNLGRLYQSMKQYEEAEIMHLRAIAIKEELLGQGDYEVGLSVGHLASLYNYHMRRHADAEKLYLRSIEINLRLFGEAYSGLEYDYRGMVNVYTELCDGAGILTYSRKLRDWRALRERAPTPRVREELLPVRDLVRRCLAMG